MVNHKTVNRAARTREDRKKQAQSYKKVRHRRLYFEWEKQDEGRKRATPSSQKKGKKRTSKPRYVYFPLPFFMEDPDTGKEMPTYLELTLHEWDSQGRIKTPVLCPIAHFGEKKCDICVQKTRTKRGNEISCKPKDKRVFLVCNVDKIGATYDTSDGETRFANPFELLEITPGEDDCVWNALDKAQDQNMFNKKIFEFFQLGSDIALPTILQPEQAKEMMAGHKAHSYFVDQVKSYDLNDLLAQILYAYDVDENDFEYFGLTVPDLSEDEDPICDEEKPRSKGIGNQRRSSRDEDDEDEDEDDSPRSRRRGRDDDEDDQPRKRSASRRDDDDDDKPRRSSSPKRSRDDEDESTDDDDDDEVMPSRRRRR